MVLLYLGNRAVSPYPNLEKANLPRVEKATLPRAGTRRQTLSFCWHFTRESISFCLLPSAFKRFLCLLRRVQVPVRLEDRRTTADSAAASTSQPRGDWHPTEGLVSQPFRRILQGLCPRDLVTSHVANLSTFQHVWTGMNCVCCLWDGRCHLTPHTRVHSGGIF